MEHGYLSHCFKSRTRDCPPSWIFKNLISEHNGALWTADFPSLQNFAQKIDRRQNYGSKSKSKMADVRHLGFVTSSYRTTHKVFSLGHIGLSNFMLIRCIVLKIWQFEFFCRFGLKCLFTPPKFWFFGAKIGEGIFGFRPQPNQFFRFRPQRFLPNFVKIGWKMRP